MPWSNTPTRTSTPAWKRLRAQVFKRDGNQCVARMADGSRCPETTNLECDHIVNVKQGGTDELDNMQTLCKWHHQRKTSREANAAPRPRRTTKRPPEAHPGLR
ncbi:HNH endonuclease [Agromyces sp. NPDC058064]|uniref:HNH endonuclease n=1 Tax=Agromyces sp. NPDC058064 TaxID=3346322 RepID=UPI0036DDDA1A